MDGIGTLLLNGPIRPVWSAHINWYPNLPSVSVNKPIAVEVNSVSARVGEYISALHASRKAFPEAICCELIS